MWPVVSLCMTFDACCDRAFQIELIIYFRVVGERAFGLRTYPSLDTERALMRTANSSCWQMPRRRCTAMRMYCLWSNAAGNGRGGQSSAVRRCCTDCTGSGCCWRRCWRTLLLKRKSLFLVIGH